MTIPAPPLLPGPQAAPSPETNRSWIKWVAIGCGGLILLAGAFAVGMYFIVRAATAGPEKVVKTFLAAAAAGDYAAAHDCFSAPLKQAQPLEEFSATAEANSMLFQTTDTTFSNRSVNTSGADLSGTVTLKEGTELPATFKLVKENGEWKLLAYHLGT